MSVVNNLWVVVCVASLFLIAKGEDGHCVWYGQCGLDPLTQKPRNCPYNGTAMPFQTSQALEHLRDLCPDLYYGPDTKTCCSDDQMQTMVGQMTVPRQVLNGCPSCLQNFLKIFCYLTCAPDQSNFLQVNVTSWQYVQDSSPSSGLQVTGVDYFLTPSFADGMFNSCRHVQMPSADEPALSILCGRPADECTPQNWLDYMGSTDNAQTPFEIDFHLRDSPVWVRGRWMTPLDVPTLPCSRFCSCRDCGTCHPSHCRPRPNLFERPFFRLEQVFINRTGHHSPIVHHNPPPTITSTVFSPVFDKEFLHQVLDLQLAIEGLRADFRNGSVGLEDICFQALEPDTRHCTVQSVLNYYQNSHANLDRIVMDSSGFFVMADYLDHLLYCFIAPQSVNDTTALHMPCVGTFRGPVFPWSVVQGFDGDHYKNATTLVLTYVVNNNFAEGQTAKAEAWEKVFIDFMANYTQHQPNMSIALAVGSSGYHPDWSMLTHQASHTLGDAPQPHQPTDHVIHHKGAAPRRPFSRGNNAFRPRVVPLK